MIKGVTHAHLGPLWYHSKHSDVPYSPNQFFGWDVFAVSYSRTALESNLAKGDCSSTFLGTIHVLRNQELGFSDPQPIPLHFVITYFLY